MRRFVEALWSGWAALTAFLAALATGITWFTSNVGELPHHFCWITGPAIAEWLCAPPPDEKPWYAIVYYGSESTPQTQLWKLKLAKSHTRLRGTALTYAPGKEPKKQILSGYVRQGVLNIAYANEESDGYGYGSFMLAPRKPWQGEPVYAGTILLHACLSTSDPSQCTNGPRYLCPVLMTRTDDPDEALKRRYFNVDCFEYPFNWSDRDPSPEPEQTSKAGR